MKKFLEAAIVLLCCALFGLLAGAIYTSATPDLDAPIGANHGAP